MADLESSKLEDYQYSPLQHPRSIRVLQLAPGDYQDGIHCQLSTVSLDDGPVFETLSYVWGTASQLLGIACGGLKIEITQSLYSALQYLRHSTETRTIWADAICINQKDNDEKSIQVQLMGEIYLNAQQVVVWLGDGSDNLSNSFSTFEMLHRFLAHNERGFPYSDFPLDNMYDITSQVFIQLNSNQSYWTNPVLLLLYHAWFTRRWIIQEIAKAKKAILQCGTKVLPWETFVNVYWYLFRSGLLAHIPGVNAIKVSGAANLALIQQDSRKKDHAPLLKSILSTRGFQCTDPRDVIYSLLGIAGDIDEYRDTVIPDYNLSVAEVYRKVTIGCIIHQKSLHPLSALYIPAAEGALELPSWVPDYSHLEKMNPLMWMRIGTGLPFHAAGDSETRARISPDGLILHAWGVDADVVTSIMPALDEVLSSDIFERGNVQDSDLAFAHWLKILYDAFVPEAGIEPSLNSLEPFWRTLMFDLTPGFDRAPNEYGSIFKKYLFSRFDMGKPDAEVHDFDTLHQFAQIQLAISAQGDSWRMCKTAQGRLGRVLKSVNVGDVICVLFGGELPYVVRPLQDGYYQFISPCFVHGLMDGEALMVEGSTAKEFSIR